MKNEVTDPFNLARFLKAQETVIDRARAELLRGRKESHWMWFIFPQLRGLGRSRMAEFYGVASADEAAAYLVHPVLGERLRNCTAIVCKLRGRSAHEIFGNPDDMKFRSSMTLFARPGAGGQFAEALAMYFGGEADPSTMELLSRK